MAKENLYKKLTIVFGILALVFAVLYFTNNNGKVSETLRSVSDRLGDCRDNVAMWANRDRTKTTDADAEKQLTDILRDCSNAVEEAQQQI